MATEEQTWNTHDAKEGIVDPLNSDKHGDAGSFHGSFMAIMQHLQ